MSVLSTRRDSRQDLSSFNAIISGLIEDRHTLRETVRLPSGIAVDLFLVSRSPIQTEGNAIEALRIGVEAIQHFMESPWPYTDLVVLLEPEIILASIMENDGRHLWLCMVSEEDHARFITLLYHELGHFLFYRGVGNDWFDQGAADVVETGPLHFVGKDSLESHHGQVRAYVAQRCTARGVEKPSTAVGRYHLECLKQNTEIHSIFRAANGWSELDHLEMYRALGHVTVFAAIAGVARPGNYQSAGERLETQIYEVFSC